LATYPTASDYLSDRVIAKVERTIAWAAPVAFRHIPSRPI